MGKWSFSGVNMYEIRVRLQLILFDLYKISASTQKKVRRYSIQFWLMSDTRLKSVAMVPANRDRLY